MFLLSSFYWNQVTEALSVIDNYLHYKKVTVNVKDEVSCMISSSSNTSNSFILPDKELHYSFMEPFYAAFEDTCPRPTMLISLHILILHCCHTYYSVCTGLYSAPRDCMLCDPRSLCCYYICQMMDPFGSTDNSLSNSCQSIDQALDRWVIMRCLWLMTLIRTDLFVWCTHLYCRPALFTESVCAC